MTQAATPSGAPEPTGVTLDAASLFVLAFIALFAYLDWITHRSLIETLLLAGLAAGAYLYRGPLLDRLNLRETVRGISPGVRRVLVALPGVLYFLIRGQGTSDAGGIVLVSMLIVIAAGALLGPAIDEKLAGFYTARNRVLPRWARMALALVAPILVAFLVIHGTLADLPALFGGTTNHPATPAGREGRFLLGSLLSAAAAWTLLREAPAGEAPGATSRGPEAEPVATEAPIGPRPASPAPVVAVPPGGLDAWLEPSTGPAAVHLDAGLPVTLGARRGDWVQVTAANGWTGWVDGRRLPGGSA